MLSDPSNPIQPNIFGKSLAPYWLKYAVYGTETRAKPMIDWV